MIETKQIVVFTLGETDFGFPIDSVSEIIKYIPITSIPNSPPYVEGACNLRSDIHTILNIKYILGLDSSIRDNKSSFIVVANDFNAGVIVDEVKMIVSPTLEDIVPIDSLTTFNSNQNILYFIKYDDKLICVLNYKNILSRSLVVVT